MKPTEYTPLNIQDERLLDFLWIDREIRRPSPNGKTWLSLIQPTCASILLCLCSHAGKTRESFPSYATIAEECGISRQSAIDGISDLIAFGFLRKGDSTKHRTNIFVIQARERWSVPANAGRKTRKDKGSPNPKRHHKQLDSQSDRLSKSDVIVNQIDSDSQSDRLLIVNKIDSDSQSDRPEVKSLKKSQMKESQEERGAAKTQASTASTASQNELSLSSSPSGMVFLSFFKGECHSLTPFQIKAICDIPDADLLKSAIEYLAGNGVEKLWKKVSLLKTKMRELSAAALPVASAAAPAAAKCGPGGVPTGRAILPPKVALRRQNLDMIEQLKASKAEAIDVEPINLKFLEA